MRCLKFKLKLTELSPENKLEQNKNSVTRAVHKQHNNTKAFIIFTYHTKQMTNANFQKTSEHSKQFYN